MCLSEGLKIKGKFSPYLNLSEADYTIVIILMSNAITNELSVSNLWVTRNKYRAILFVGGVLTWLRETKTQDAFA